jgi:hypothetical protein
MGSNVNTVGPQGGGDKKAGFPYQIGRGYRTSIAFHTCNPANYDKVNKYCCNLVGMQYTVNPKTNISRPIGSVMGYPNTYWKVPGVGKN